MPTSRAICQVCGKTGHRALNCYRRFDHAFQAAGPTLTAYTAGPSQPRDLNWNPDTRATHHITSDLNNLNFHYEAYDGLDEIQVGNGTRLAIKNTGTFKLSPNFILHVPQITKNLLSIQKFTFDNNVYVEFHPSFVFLLRIASLRKFYIKARVDMTYITSSLPRLHHLVCSLALAPPLWTGMLASVILPIV